MKRLNSMVLIFASVGIFSSVHAKTNICPELDTITSQMNKTARNIVNAETDPSINLKYEKYQMSILKKKYEAAVSLCHKKIQE